MTLNGWAQIALFCILVLALTRPLGGYLDNVMAGRRTLLSPVLVPVERGFYRLAGVDPAEEQSWWVYARAMIVFHIAGFALLYLLLRLQDLLPFNPQGMAAVPPDLAGNTAVSFLTNTNWQSYGGESTMSYLSQMTGLAVQNFLSAATGIALAVALVRGFARAGAKGIGNFWADLVRITLYVLLPLCILLTVFFVWQGVPQNLGSSVEATTLEGARQTIAQGPVASQLSIKMLGTNGGGFFNANSAHPYENPTAFSNLVQMLAIFAIGAALTNLFGRAVGDERQGWAILAAMGVLFLAGVFVAYWAEAGGNPLVAALGVDNAAGNMEGKEVRFGVALSALFAVITTAASCGAVNAMHDSFMPLGGMIPLLNILLGEIIIGGVGAGLYGMLLFAVLAIFLAGLMVGRTPEYVGKKIEAREVKFTMLAILSLPLAILGFTALASVVPAGLAGPANAGPHGFSEILYAYTSAAGNNGSAFAGLSANTLFYNGTLAVAMMVGRFAVIIPMLAVAGSLAAKRKAAASAGTFPTHGALFVGLLIGAVLIVGGLTFLPALALGPIAELYSFSRNIAGVIDLYDLLWIVVSHLARLLKAEVVVLMPDDGMLTTRAAFPPDSELSDADLAAARWSWDADRPAGRGTDTLPGGRWLFLPLRTSRAAVAVIGVLPGKDGHELSAGERRLLEAVGNQAAVAIERVTLAEDIDQARLGAERERLRSSMLTSVSHDLRTPLASIIGSLSSLRSYGERYDAATRAELLATAQAEAERLDRFVGNLLDMTRLDAGAIEPKREAVEVGDLMSTTLRRAQPLVKGHVVSSTVPPGLPPLSLDFVLAEQVLFNLLDNAAKYAAAGGRIDIEARRSGERVEIVVRDEGPGIPEADLDRIFEKFYRADAGDRRRAGTGLGLAIARGFVEAMGGTLVAQNRPDRSGAEFVVSFPAS